MKISRIRSLLYRTARTLGDVDAVVKGRPARRLVNRGVGRLTGRLLRKILRY